MLFDQKASSTRTPGSQKKLHCPTDPGMIRHWISVGSSASQKLLIQNNYYNHRQPINLQRRHRDHGSDIVETQGLAGQGWRGSARHERRALTSHQSSRYWLCFPGGAGRRCKGTDFTALLRGLLSLSSAEHRGVPQEEPGRLLRFSALPECASAGQFSFFRVL